MGSQGMWVVLNTGARAKPRAGRVNAAAATAPAPLAVPTMNRRRVTVSPSNAPGIFRSAVYFESLGLRRLGTSGERRSAGRRIQQGQTGYRQQRGNGHERPRTRQSLRGVPAVRVAPSTLRIPADPECRFVPDL